MTTCFRAMGCDVVVQGADRSSLGAIVELFAERERVFSRFRSDSELSRVNAASEETVLVSETFAQGVRDALLAASVTDGLVVPTLSDALIGAGYDRDLADVVRRPGPRRPARPTPTGAVRLRGGVLTRASGVHLDLNGVVKSRAVDDATALLTARGFVSAGGDIAVTTPTVIALPGGGNVTVVGGGIATSGTLTRRWSRDGEVGHHLIDPLTGGPSRVGWVAVTVAAGSCLAADVAAKAAFLLGDAGIDWLDDHALPGRFVDESGRVVTSRLWDELVEPRPLGEAA